AWHRKALRPLWRLRSRDHVSQVHSFTAHRTARAGEAARLGRAAGQSRSPAAMLELRYEGLHSEDRIHTAPARCSKESSLACHGRVVRYAPSVKRTKPGGCNTRRR